MPDPKDVKITKLEIQLSDAKITLTTADAKKLYEALSDLFASKSVEVHRYHDYWTYRPYYTTYYLGYGAAGLSQGAAYSNMAASQNVQDSTLQMAVQS